MRDHRPLSGGRDFPGIRIRRGGAIALRISRQPAGDRCARAAPQLDHGRRESGQRGVRQTAYRVLVASTASRLAKNHGDLWDSGRVQSDQSNQLEYAGKPLRSSQQVFWKVRIWDEREQASAWSEPASWTMGVLNDADWHAEWISAKEAVMESQPFAGIHTAGRRCRRPTPPPHPACIPPCCCAASSW